MPLVLPNFFCASLACTALVSAFLTVVIYGSPLVVALKFVSVSFVQLDTITTILYWTLQGTIYFWKLRGAFFFIFVFSIKSTLITIF